MFAFERGARCGTAARAATAMDPEIARDIARALRENANRPRDGVYPTSTSLDSLASSAYEKLRFDYPIISAQALDALGTVLRRRARSHMTTTTTTMEGKPYALTTKMVRAICEGAERGDRGGSGGDARDGAEERDGDDAIVRAYQNVCAVICVEFPLAVMTMNDEDANEALRMYIPEEEGAWEEEGESESESESESERESEREGCAFDDGDGAAARDLHSSDDDWEPLESTSAWTATALGDEERFARMSKREAVDVKLRALIGELRPSRLGADALRASAKSSWEMTSAADSVLKLFDACCRENVSEARRELRTIPLRVLRERWARVPIGTFGVDLGLARALESLKFGAADQDAEDQRIALELLAYLCVQLGAETLGGCSVDVQNASISASARSKLWVHVNRTIPVVTNMLEQSLRVMERESEDSKWQDSVGLSALLLTYYVGNANTMSAQDVGERLVRTGCLRALVRLFISLRASPFAEAVRRALLLACLASDAVYKFVAQVPSIQTTLIDGEFAKNGTLAGHGAMWHAALREPAAEEQMAMYFDYFAENIADERALYALQGALPLLRACARASKAGGRSLFIENGPLSRALQRVNSKTSEIVAATTRVRNELMLSPSTHVDDNEDKKKVERPIAPDVEKRRETVLEISRALKVLLSPSDDALVAHKSD